MSWSGGLAEWTEANTTYLSIAFTWKIDEAYARAVWARAQGRRVIAGGPAMFTPQMRALLTLVADCYAPGDVAAPAFEAVTHHNPLATSASRGCPVGCWFCIVPKMEKPELLPDFVPRPILCDNNLSALPADYQDYVIAKYRAAGVTMIDANSGFEPATFTPEVFARWRPLIDEGGGPWRFAYDQMGPPSPGAEPESVTVRRTFDMLRDISPRRKRVYVLIGNEPFEECMARIYETIAHGCEPHVQPVVALNSLDRRPLVRHDWSERKLRDVARWANGHVWKKARFEDYDRTIHNRRLVEIYDEQQGLFTAAEARR